MSTIAPLSHSSSFGVTRSADKPQMLSLTPEEGRFVRLLITYAGKEVGFNNWVVEHFQPKPSGPSLDELVESLIAKFDVKGSYVLTGIVCSAIRLQLIAA